MCFIILANMGLGNQWDPEEDDLLAQCWLEVSCDPVTGAYQKKEAFWQRVYDLFLVVPRILKQPQDDTWKT
jgi:hypothetical protein